MTSGLRIVWVCVREGGEGGMLLYKHHGGGEGRGDVGGDSISERQKMFCGGGGGGGGGGVVMSSISSPYLFSIPLPPLPLSHSFQQGNGLSLDQLIHVISGM